MSKKLFNNLLSLCSSAVILLSGVNTPIVNKAVTNAAELTSTISNPII